VLKAAAILLQLQHRLEEVAVALNPLQHVLALEDE